MKINYSGKTYYFREVDVEGISEEELKSLADKYGEIIYDPHNGNTYLYIDCTVVERVLYGMEDR